MSRPAEHFITAADYLALERQADGSWRYSAVQGLETAIDIATIGCVSPSTEGYERVTFPEPRGRLRLV
ncbi:MAG: hypothetical protein LM550_13135 [Candidatus Contendobacter sp.]|jgi:hypothetical protein|nr:hypothetical protein [Gammaproteobacteria bacterium]MCC8994601.1 hypothetical protein [Candidatus Contendobacter sp.]